LNSTKDSTNPENQPIHNERKTKSRWTALAEKVYTVKPRHSLTVEFPNIDTANEASDFICNHLNKRIGQSVFRKQIVLKQNGQATVYFSHLTSGESKKISE
jgi:hypothetical protein